MKSKIILSSCISSTLFFLSSAPPVQAAPGVVSQIPLFVAPPTPPNIFFMLDDSGSMLRAINTNSAITNLMPAATNYYNTQPNNGNEWRAWCRGANAVAYDPNTNYKPWAGNQPNTNTPFPDMVLSNVWVEPRAGSGPLIPAGGNGGTLIHLFHSTGTADISDAPVITWVDSNSNGQFDADECPTQASDPRVQRADTLPAAQQTNFANWFAYSRTKERVAKSAITQVIANSNARMGMATLHSNGGVGVRVKDMTNAANKIALLDNIINIESTGATPLRARLDWVGQYFDKATGTPPGLNIGTPSSPILSQAQGGECQQNFVILITDGFWNGQPVGVGSQDSTVDNTFVYPAHQDTYNNTLADVAMRWYKTDLATSLDPKVPVQTGNNTLNLDENPEQHLVTFGVAFGVSGTINSDPIDRNLPFAWPSVSANTAETVDDLRHAAYNGRGKFLSAKSPAVLTTALQNIISDIESRQGSAASVSFNSTSLLAGTTLFFASFDTTEWSGDLEAYSLNTTTGNLSTTPLWSAASLLDSKTNTNIANQAIYTLGLDAGGIRDGVLLNWSTANPQIAANTQDDFKRNQDTTIESAPFTKSQERLDFIRGDTSHDGVDLMRQRVSRLGDIIHSAPVFVGAPISGWPDSGSFGTTGARYSTYQASLNITPRNAMVYVGANDGLLHGFNSSDGEQVFAYLPSAPASPDIGSGLHYLTESNYNHKYYVDGQPVAADVFIKSDPAATAAWKTILVGSLRGGGRGLFALDVTDPSQYTNTQAAAKASVLWEFTDQDDPDLGYTFSVPQITMMNNGKWAAIVGNGYNGSSGKAKLMIIFIEEGVDGQWTATDYVKLDTGVGSPSDINGLSTPALVDLNDDGMTDRIYAGDLKGNMWAFDVSDTSTSNWDLAHGITPLFAAGSSQAITMKPLVVKPEADWVADTGSNTPNLMVYFGTGQYISSADASSTTQQAMYGVWDSGSSAAVSDLVSQSMRTGFASGARVLTTNPVSLTPAGDRGWVIDLPEAGERVIVDAFSLEGLVFFNTMTPSSAPCSAGGSSWLMAVNMKTGGNPDIVAFDFSGDGTLDNSDKLADGSDSTAVAGIAFGHGIASATSVITTASGDNFGYTSGTDSKNPIKTPLPGGVTVAERRGWRQLFN